jgi:signal peptidase I
MSLFRRKNRIKKRKTAKDRILDLVSGIGIPLILALIIKTSVVEAYVIPSGSMENTLYAGDQILGNKFIYGMKLPIPFIDIRLPAIEKPKTGDIVIFKFPPNPAQNYIKRCIATEGQTVEIQNKRVYVDGKLLQLPDEGKYTDDRMIPYNTEIYGGLRDNIPPFKVPENKLFMMGDNRDNSADSRFWGFVDEELVMAKALVVLWSWEYPEQLNTNSGDLSNLDIWVYTFKNLPYLIRHIRPERFGKIAN